MILSVKGSYDDKLELMDEVTAVFLGTHLYIMHCVFLCHTGREFNTFQSNWYIESI